MRYSRFNSDEPCVKCGAIGGHVKWDHAAPPSRPTDVIPPALFEVLRVTCWRCGYEWFRDPLDAEKIAIS